MESALNTLLRTVMQRRIQEATIVEQEGLQEGEDMQDAWQVINCRLDELTDRQLTRLVESIRKLQMGRESEKIVGVLG